MARPGIAAGAAASLSRPPARRHRAFSLIEILVVIGIIAVLIGLLAPAISRAQAQAKSVQCKSNLRQIGQAMLMYANENNGDLFPTDIIPPEIHAIAPINQCWFLHVLHPKPPLDPSSTNRRDWTPPILLCPADVEDPANYHSYVLNEHLHERGIRYHTRNIPHRTADRVVVMGEKVSNLGDYYLQTQPDTGSEYHKLLEHYRHGIHLRSNYLYLDLHVDNDAPQDNAGGVDPWDVLPAGDAS